MLLSLLLSLPLAAAPPPPAWLAPYDAVREQLVGDHLTEATAAAIPLQRALPDADVKTAAGRLAVSGDLGEARAAFGELSKLLLAHAAAGAPGYTLPAGTPVFHCTMTEHYGYWLQDESRIGNPYEGQAMPRCGAKSSVADAMKSDGAPAER